jgi:hypothetical protein
MSMKYFTLSAVCMLIFCMLLALSGTTDFPGNRPEIVPSSGLSPPSPELNQPGKGQALASAYPAPQDLQSQADTDDRPAAVEDPTRNRPVFLVGVVFIAGWVLLSFRLLYKSKG